MKTCINIVLLVLGLTANAPLLAQQWCPPGAEWNYNIIGWGSEGCGTATYLGDTILNGRVAQRIEHQELVHNYFTGTTTSSTYSMYTTYDTGVVYLYVWVVLNWDTMYWFNAPVGARWSPAGYEVDVAQCPPPGGMVEVIGTGMEIVEGIELSFVDVQYLDFFGLPADVPIRIHERIGSRLMGLPPVGCSIVAWPWVLRTYSDGLGTNYDSEQVELCPHITGVGNIENIPRPIPYPNPGYDHVRFRGLRSVADVQFHDAYGRMVLSVFLLEPDQRIDVGMLASGPYVITARTEQGTSKKWNWMKE